MSLRAAFLPLSHPQHNLLCNNTLPTQEKERLLRGCFPRLGFLSPDPIKSLTPPPPISVKALQTSQPNAFSHSAAPNNCSTSAFSANGNFSCKRNTDVPGSFPRSGLHIPSDLFWNKWVTQAHTQIRIETKLSQLCVV